MARKGGRGARDQTRTTMDRLTRTLVVPEEEMAVVQIIWVDEVKDSQCKEVVVDL